MADAHVRIPVDLGLKARYMDMGDGTHAQLIATYATGGVGVDRELVQTTYVCVNAFTGAQVGDVITSVQVIETESNPPTTIAVVWRNQTTGVDLSTPPSYADIDVVGTEALTNTQLRAAPLDVNLPSGAATVTAQNSQTTLLSNLDYDLGARNDAVASSDTGTFSLIAFIKRGLQNWATLLARIPALISSRIPTVSSVPYASSPPVLLQVQTSTTGSNFVSFSSQACSALELLAVDPSNNAIGVHFEYLINGAGLTMPVFYSDGDIVTGITNANQVSVRRVDQLNTQIKMYAKAHVL